MYLKRKVWSVCLCFSICFDWMLCVFSAHSIEIQLAPQMVRYRLHLSPPSVRIAFNSFHLLLFPVFFFFHSLSLFPLFHSFTFCSYSLKTFLMCRIQPFTISSNCSLVYFSIDSIIGWIGIFSFSSSSVIFSWPGALYAVSKLNSISVCDRFLR